MSSEAELGGFLEAAGRSLTEAQGTLGGGVSDIPAAVAIAQAELEVKAAISRGADGALRIETLSAQDIRSGSISPGVLSTVRIQYVAVTGEAPTATSGQAAKTARGAIDSVRTREDVVALDRILGGLAYDAVFVPPGRWLVTATDSEQRVVREILVPDEAR